MLTRLEVAGFKNLVDLTVDFGAFTCIAGENGTGKSNVFDAIEFLANLSDLPMLQAAQRVRGLEGERVSDPRDLFWNGAEDDSRSMRFAAEMLVPRDVEDDLGSPTRASTTFLRYEVEIGYARPEDGGGVGRLTLRGEDLTHITIGEAARHLKFPHRAKDFRRSVVTGQRRGGPFLETAERDGVTIINMAGDGGSRGRPQPQAASNSKRSFLSTVTSNDYPTILAARREMQSWRRLSLEPSALRAPVEFDAPRNVAVNGKHLASALHRVAHTPDVDGRVDPTRVYARIAARLSDLVRVRVDSIEVDRDEARQVYVLYLREKGGARLPARALSEGTLRFLALCLLLEDPTVTGLICMEEPENGIHPAHLSSMVELVRDLAVDTDEAPGPNNPFRQVIVNTHSPGVVQLSSTDDLLLAENVSLVGREQQSGRGLHLTPHRESWRARSQRLSFSRGDLLDYLTAQPGAQTKLDLTG